MARAERNTWGEAAAREIALLHWAESQPVGDLWSRDDARWATALARATPASQGLQRERARHAARRLGERDERLAAFLRRPLGGTRWVGRGALLGLVLGVLLDRLGGAQMNLLALPLWGVLALQLIGYAVFVLRRGALPFDGLWARLVTRSAGLGASAREASLLAHWLRLSAPLQQARAALLWHATVLGLSLGLVMGLYARALQTEYVIGWESTFLSAPQVQALADIVLAPAAWLSGTPVPAVAPLRHGAGQLPRGPAGAWLHLLAVTVGLVALPRLALALSAGLRSARLARGLPLPAGPGDWRLAVRDPEGRLAGSLLGGEGEVLSSPEGDRLLITQLGAERPAAAPARGWARWLKYLAPPAPPAHDTVLDAQALPPGGPGWPAQQVQLLALQPPAAQQAAWARLLAAWRAEQQARDDEALQALADTLQRLLAERLPLQKGEQPLAALQRQLEQALTALSERLSVVYGQLEAPVPAVVNAPASGTLPLRQRQPVTAKRGAMLGGVMGGALAGLKADVAAGGLLLGGGTLAGAVVGGLGAAGLGGWLNPRLQRREPLQLDEAALPLLAEAVLRCWLAALPHPDALPRVSAVVAAQTWSMPLEPPLRAAMDALLAPQPL